MRFSRFLVTYPRVANFSIGRHSKRWNDQTAVVYDSFERASGCRYFAIIDQDEFFIPGKYRTLQEMFVSSLTLPCEIIDFPNICLVSPLRDTVELESNFLFKK